MEERDKLSICDFVTKLGQALSTNKARFYNLAIDVGILSSHLAFDNGEENVISSAPPSEGLHSC